MVSARNTVSGGAGGCIRWACSEATSASNVLGLAGSRVWAAGSSYDGKLCEWAKTLVIKAIELMKCGKAAGISLNLAEMLKASGVEGPHQICDLIADIIHFGKILTEREESTIVSLYKGKGVALAGGIIEAWNC